MADSKVIARLRNQGTVDQLKRPEGWGVPILLTDIQAFLAEFDKLTEELYEQAVLHLVEACQQFDETSFFVTSNILWFTDYEWYRQWKEAHRLLDLMHAEPGEAYVYANNEYSVDPGEVNDWINVQQMARMKELAKDFVLDAAGNKVFEGDTVRARNQGDLVCDTDGTEVLMDVEHDRFTVTGVVVSPATYLHLQMGAQRFEYADPQYFVKVEDTNDES